MGVSLVFFHKIHINLEGIFVYISPVGRLGQAVCDPREWD